MNGAELVVEGLRKQGVEQVFGYPGGAIMPVYDALYESGVNHLLCRHEQGAVMAAIGYARASGKVGVCIATSGPGATNLITGLADALADSVPLVALTGQVPVAAMGTDAFQECDILGMSLSCTKHSILVEDVAELPAALEEAFAVAQEGRPGPVLVDLPKNVQQATVPEAVRVAAEKSFCPTKPASDTVASDTLAQACELLHTARKPVLYVGGGVGMAGAVEELRSFIRKTGIPVVTTLKGLGAPDPEGAETLGMLGMHGTHAANLAVQECDLLIAAGARFDDRVTGKLESFAPHASVLHMDIDPAELGKRRTPHVRMADDLKTLLPALEAGVQEELAASLMSWRAHVAELKKSDLPPEISGHDPEAGINAPQFLRALSVMLPPRSVVTTDVGQHQMWSAQHMRFDGPENFITSGGMGTMGFGLPAALGAQAARPEDQVVCVTGDGSFLMNVQELATLGRGKLPVRIVLLDNQRLGMVRQWQELFFEGRFSETILNDNPDFVLLARAFGIPGRRIEKPAEVPEAITEMLASEGPYLLHVSIKALENVWPLVPPGAGNETMLEDMP